MSKSNKICITQCYAWVYWLYCLCWAIFLCIGIGIYSEGKDLRAKTERVECVVVNTLLQENYNGHKYAWVVDFRGAAEEVQSLVTKEFFFTNSADELNTTQTLFSPNSTHICFAHPARGYLDYDERMGSHKIKVGGDILVFGGVIGFAVWFLLSLFVTMWRGDDKHFLHCCVIYEDVNISTC